MKSKKLGPQGPVSSDLHLTPQTWSDRPGLRGDAEWGMEQICRAAITNKAQFFLAAGDLVDKRVNDTAPIDILSRWLHELERNGVAFYFVQGQHELATPTWVHTVAPWATHLHGQQTTLGPGGVKVYGLDYQLTRDLPEALQTIPPDTELFVAHQVWAEFMAVNHQASLGMVPHAELVVTGDYHRHMQDKLVGATGQKLQVFSPGATHMRKIDEPSVHFFYWFDGSRTQTYALRSRGVLLSDLRSPGDLVSFLRECDKTLAEQLERDKDLPGDLQTPIWKISYDVQIPNAHCQIHDAVGGRAHIFETQIWPQTELQQISRQRHAEVIDLGLEGCLELLVPDKDSALYQDLKSLLEASKDSSAVGRVLNAIRGRFIGDGNVTSSEGEDESARLARTA